MGRLISRIQVRPLVFVFVVIAQLFLPAHALPATFYAGARQTDAVKGRVLGLSPASPFSSIGEAVQAAAGGDTIYVLPGTYRETIELRNKAGQPERPLCLFGYSASGGSYPVIDGGVSRPTSDEAAFWIRIENCAWLEVARLEFRNGWASPIRIDGSSYLTFRDCRFFGAKRVIEAYGAQTHHLLVERCSWDQGGDYLWTLKQDSLGMDAWTSMHHGALAYFNGSLVDVSGTGGSVVIRGNTIINAFNGIRFRGRTGCDGNIEIYDNSVSRVRDNDFEPEYYTYNLHIYHNRSHNIHRTLSVTSVEGGKIYYYGNVVTTDNDPWTVDVCRGFWKIYGGERLPQYPVYAFNNSFWGCGEAFSTTHGRVMMLKHWNNAYYFTNNGGWGLRQWEPTNEFDHDISSREWPPSLVENGQEKHGRITDIGFVDGAAQNLTLQDGSPGIDAGKVVSLPELGWRQEYRGAAPDIGAYEQGVLVEGPPFRFMPPPEGQISYREKPRICRDRIEGNAVVLDFSGPLDSASVKMDAIVLYRGETQLSVAGVSFPNPYRLVIETRGIPGSGALSLRFGKLPRGANGEEATCWASTVRIRGPREQ